MKGYLFLAAILGFLQVSLQETLKCLVCEQVMREIVSAIEKEDPLKTIQVGSFRIEPDGSQQQSQIKYAGSEIHLNEVLETVCNSADDLAQAKHKETGELVLLNLARDVDKLSTHDLVPDPELNRSIKYNCESFVEDHEEEIIDIFRKSPTISAKDSIEKVCRAAGYCSIKRHSEL